MDAAALNRISKALATYTRETTAANAKFFKALLAFPEGRETLRRQLAQLNLDPPTIERAMSGQIQPQDAAALVGQRLGQN